jgi:hypothetical protein
LIKKPDLVAIVSVHTATPDAYGFRLFLTIVDALIIPDDHPTEKSSLELRCIWNQPYLYFSPEEITAPYSFYLHFGEAGITRVRELWRALPADRDHLAPMLLGLLRSCFSVGGPFGPSEAEFRRQLQSLASLRQ